MAHSLSSRRAVSTGRPRFFAFVSAAFEARRQRRALANLDAHLQRDLGLDTADIVQEADRPLWDVPQSWRL